MDAREGMPPFYLRGVSGSGSHGGSGSPGGGVNAPPGFKNPNMSPLGHTPIRVGPMGSPYPVDHNPSLNFHHRDGGGGGGNGGGGVGSVGSPRSGLDSGVKRKRGRPRKYSGDGSDMGLALVPASQADGYPSSVEPKKIRGRPRGSGRKQRLADVGEWMSTSAGLAFTPHVIHVEEGEDVAAKILAFAQQRPRALCVLSGNGGVSEVDLRQFESSGGTVTYQGGFEILHLSGSYLLPEAGAPNNRTGGLSISICSTDGHVIGGAIGGRLIASSLVQVLVCSFVYGGNNSKKTKPEAPTVDAKSPGVELNETSPDPSQTDACRQDSQAETSGPHTEFDLTRG